MVRQISDCATYQELQCSNFRTNDKMKKVTLLFATTFVEGDLCGTPSVSYLNGAHHGNCR